MTGSIEATDVDLIAQVMDYATRANPYPLYARLRETPVVRTDDGLYLVSTHASMQQGRDLQGRTSYHYGVFHAG